MTRASTTLPGDDAWQILDNSPDAILVTTIDGTVVYANRRVETMFGVDNAVLVGASVDRLLPERERSQRRAIRRGILEGQHPEWQGVTHRPFALHHDGHEFPIEVHLATVQTGQGSALISTIRDATEQQLQSDSLPGILEASLNEIYVFDALTLQFLSVNLGARRNLGYTMAQLSRLTPVDIKPAYDLATFTARIAPLRHAPGKHMVFETEHQRKDGSRYPVEVHLQFAQLGKSEVFIAIILDMTERVQAERALRDSEARFREMTNSLPFIVWLHDANGSQESVNQTFLDFFGITAEQLHGSGWTMLVHEEDEAAYVSAFEASVREQRPFHGICRARNGQGEWRWLESFGRPRMTASGEFNGIIGSSIDITEQRQLENDLRRLSADLSESDKRKTEFIATLAHELRNPLAPILTTVELLQQAAGNPAAVGKVTAMVERQVKQMARLIEDLLDLSRISRGKIELRNKRVELASALAQAVEAAAPQSGAARQSLRVTLPASPLTVYGDAARITQVVGNLLNNAIKFSEPGGNVDLVLERDEDDAVIRVRDNGIGIAKDRLSEVFEMFTQLPHDGRLREGLGIGLALALNLVQLHKGTITVHSAGKGKGSEFSVRLPLLIEAIDSDELPASSPTRDDSFSLATPHRILIADDNEDAAMSLAMLLEAAGFQTMTAFDGQEALAMAQADRPDVAILDIGMPMLNGHEVARKIRATEQTSTIKLIALTGWGHADDRDRSRAAGFDAHFVKPVALNDIMERLTAWAAGS